MVLSAISELANSFTPSLTPRIDPDRAVGFVRTGHRPNADLPYGHDRESVRVVDYDPTHRSAFERLNAERIADWFTIEDSDR